MYNCVSLFQKFSFTTFINCRNFASESVKPMKYYGFTYYPRHKDFKDPPYEPSKLFLIIRRKSMKGLHHLEKKVMEALNIDGEKTHYGHINVVKNIPEINCLLWKVKHLIIIKPITWSGKLPEDGDFSGTYLKDSGELIICPKLKVGEQTKEINEQYHGNTYRLTQKYMRGYLLKKWVQGFSKTL